MGTRAGRTSTRPQRPPAAIAAVPAPRRRTAALPQTTREERITASLETWRVLNGDKEPERAARAMTAQGQPAQAD